MKTIYGYSFIELLVVLTIVSIIANFSYSSYKAYTERIKRHEAVINLLNIATKLENYYSEYGTYLKFNSGVDLGQSAPNGWYRLKIIKLTPNTYELEAYNPHDESFCNTLTLNNHGEKGEDTSCWR